MNLGSVARPADQLLGLDLDGGWKVEEKVDRPLGVTGGNFSVCYHVRNVDQTSRFYGRVAFLKALDYTFALTAPDVPLALRELTDAFVFERDLVNLCKNRRMRHVVEGVTSGAATLDSFGHLAKVDYLIFELAHCDIRRVLHIVDYLDIAWVFRTLHNVANGLRQLHDAGVTHQDLKPSNVLDFGALRKIGDLGRAHRLDTTGPYDSEAIAGDYAYAAPELLYGHVHPDQNIRRRAADLYQLGSLMLFLFAKTSLTPLLVSALEPSHRPPEYGGTYHDILPELRQAFDVALTTLTVALPESLRDKSVAVFRELGDPDLDYRGAPHVYLGRIQRLNLQRYVSRFDNLARRAAIEIIRVG